jgi:hypothetical protein
VRATDTAISAISHFGRNNSIVARESVGRIYEQS